MNKMLSEKDFHDVLAFISYKAKDMLEAKNMPRKASLLFAEEIENVGRYVKTLFKNPPSEENEEDCRKLHNRIHNRLSNTIYNYCKYIFNSKGEMEFFTDKLLISFYETVKEKEQNNK